MRVESNDWRRNCWYSIEEEKKQKYPRLGISTGRRSEDFRGSEWDRIQILVDDTLGRGVDKRRLEMQLLSVIACVVYRSWLPLFSIREK